MCGIIGYVGNKEAFPLLLEGLKRLEYRGYDSAGICVSNNVKLNLVKKKGKIQELTEDFSPDKLKGNIGIAHTRWATHGAPTHDNAHPHIDDTGRFALVHNGIIENYRALKEFLTRKGVVVKTAGVKSIELWINEYSPTNKAKDNEPASYDIYFRGDMTNSKIPTIEWDPAGEGVKM